MPDVNLFAVAAGGVALLLIGAVYYAALGDQLGRVSNADADVAQMPPWKIAVELVRCLILAAIVAGLAVEAEIDSWTGGLLLGLVLWIGFPFVLWVGAVIHERTPVRLAAIHAGDWLIKLLVIGVIASIWQ